MSLRDRRRLAGELLRRHVLRRAGDAGAGVGADRRDAEVGDADVAVAVDHHVGRLQVAMQHAALVRRGDAGAQLPRELDRLVLRDAADAAEQRGQILAVHVLHRQEAAAVGVAEVVEPADVLVRHLARDAQLVVELRQAAIVGRDAAGQELQRDRLIERQVVGAIHFAHAAASEQGDEPIAAGDDRAGREGARRKGRPGRRLHTRRANRRVVVEAGGHDRILLEERDMMRKLMAGVALSVAMTAFVFAQGGRPASPAGTAAVEVGGKYDPKAAEPTYQGGKWIEITYGRPIKRGRDVFGGTGGSYGKVANPDAPVWRAGANNTTQLKTEVPLVINGKTVAPGTYTMFINLRENAWTLIVSNMKAQTRYDPKNTRRDLGRLRLHAGEGRRSGADDDGDAAV